MAKFQIAYLKKRIRELEEENQKLRNEKEILKQQDSDCNRTTSVVRKRDQNG